MEELDTAAFAAAVEQRRELWDTRCTEYKDRKWKKDSWSEVARVVYRNYDTMSQKEKDDAVKTVIWKWRNLRDAYARDIRLDEQAKATGSARKRKRYVFANTLRFLDDVLRQRVIRAPKPSTAKKEDIEEEAEQEVEEEEEYYVELSPDDTHSSLVFAKMEPESTSMETVEDPLIDIATTKNETRRSNFDAMDEDMAFFYSVLPSVRGLSDDDKLQFRIDVLGLLKRLKSKKRINL